MRATKKKIVIIKSSTPRRTWLLRKQKSDTGLKKKKNCAPFQHEKYVRVSRVFIVEFFPRRGA